MGIATMLMCPLSLCTPPNQRRSAQCRPKVNMNVRMINAAVKADQKMNLTPVFGIAVVMRCHFLGKGLLAQELTQGHRHGGQKQAVAHLLLETQVGVEHEPGEPDQQRQGSEQVQPPKQRVRLSPGDEDANDADHGDER